MADDWKYVGPAETTPAPPATDPQWKYVAAVPDVYVPKHAVTAENSPLSDYANRGVDTAVSLFGRAKSFLSEKSFAPDTSAASALDGQKQKKTSWRPEAQTSFDGDKKPTSWSPEATDYKYISKDGSVFAAKPDVSTPSAFDINKQKTAWSPEATTKVESPLDIRNLIPSVDDVKMLGNTKIQPIPLNQLQAYVGKNPEMPATGASLKVNLSQHNMTYYVDGTPIRSFSIASGAKNTPSPTGKFKVMENPSEKEMKENDDYDYYHRWLGFHTIQYPAGGGNYPNSNEPYEAYYGIHGTPHPESIGKDASHGCIRMKYEDVDKLAQLVDVNTPVIITKDK